MRDMPSWAWAIAGLLFFWLGSAALSELLLGNSPSPVVVGAVITLALVLVVVATDVSYVGAIFFGIVSTFSLVVLGASLPLLKLLLSYTLWVPLVSLSEYATSIPYITAVFILGLVGAIGLATSYTVWKTGPAVNWLFTLRMVISPIVLAVLLIAFFTAIWRIIEIVAELGMWLLGIELDTRIFIARLFTFGLLAGFVYFEFSRISTIEHRDDTTVISSENFPELHATTTRVASQLDVPVPTIAVSERAEPEAITKGYRLGSITLVLSRGLIDALDDVELEAVIAHELAHVANMDAMVTTLASLPVLFADGLQDRIYAWGVDDDSIVRGALLVIATLVEYVSRPIVAGLSRARESAADRTAATITGSPTALASALRTLDRRIDEIPTEDLRESSGLSSLSILPLNPVDGNVFVPSEVGRTKKSINAISRRITRLIFATHPPVERRIDALIEFSEERRTEP